MNNGATGRGTLPLYLVIFLDSIGYALIMPYLPFILMRQGADARMGGLVVAVHAVAAIGAAPILGRLSDRWGRKPVLLATVFGTALAYLVFAFAPNIWVLLAARAIAGVMAGNAGVVQAALTDATSSEERGKAMSFSNAAWGMGYLIGPAAGAGLTIVTAQASGLYVGLLAVVASGISLVVVWTQFIDTPVQRRTEAAGVTQGTSGLGLVVRMLLLFGLLSIAQNGLASMTGFWANASFGWTQRGVSLLMFGVAACIIFVQLMVMPRLFRVLKSGQLLLVALGAIVVGCVAIWFAKTNVPVMGASAALLFCGITAGQAVVSTVLSKTANINTRGRVMGAAVSAGAVGRVIGPPAFGVLFVTTGSQSPFLAVLLLMLGFLAWRLIDVGAHLMGGRMPVEVPD